MLPIEHFVLSIGDREKTVTIKKNFRDKAIVLDDGEAFSIVMTNVAGELKTSIDVKRIEKKSSKNR